MVPLFFVRVSKDKQAKLRIIVPKRVAKKAVQRNLIRRRLREAITNIFSTGEKNLVVTALPSIVGKSFQEIKTAVDQAIKIP